MYVIQHCFICRTSDSTVSEDAGIEPRTVTTLALTALRSSHSARSHPHSARSHSHSARSHPHSARSHPHSARFHSHSARSHPHSARSHPQSPRSHSHSTRSHPHSARSHSHSAWSHPHSARSHPHSAISHPHSARSHSHSARSHSHSARSHSHSARSHSLTTFVKNNRERTWMEAAMSRGKSSSSSSPSRGCTARLDRRDLAPKNNNFKKIMVWRTWTRDRKQRKIHGFWMFLPWKPVLRIRDVYPGLSRIPGPNFPIPNPRSKKNPDPHQ